MNNNQRYKVPGFDGLYIRSNRLYIAVRYQGQTTYNATGLEATKPNIRACAKKLATIQEQIKLDLYDQCEHFPKTLRARVKAKATAKTTRKGSLSQVAAIWLEHWIKKNQGAAKSSIRNHTNILKHHLGALAHVDINTINKQALIDWSEALVNTKDPSSPLQIKRRKNIYSTLRAVFLFACDREYIKGNNPFELFLLWDQTENKADNRAAMEAVKISPEVPLRANEISAIFERAPCLGWDTELNMIGFNLEVGLRPGELFALAWENVDFNKKTAHICQQFTAGEFKQLKTIENRTVPLSDRAIDFLKKQKQLSMLRTPLTYEFISSSANKKITESRTCKFVFIYDVSGEPYKHSSDFLNRWNTILETAGVEKYTKSGESRRAYTMRHTLASRMFTAGATIHEAAAMLGNKPETCKENYARIIPEEQKFNHDRLNKLLAR